MEERVRININVSKSLRWQYKKYCLDHNTNVSKDLSQYIEMQVKKYRVKKAA